MDDSFDHICENPHGDAIGLVAGVDRQYVIVYCPSHFEHLFHVLDFQAHGEEPQCILHDVTFLEALAFAGNRAVTQVEQVIDQEAANTLMKRGQRLAITGDITTPV